MSASTAVLLAAIAGFALGYAAGYLRVLWKLGAYVYRRVR